MYHGFHRLLGPSWLWSYCSWICNYLSNQCPSPLTFWVWISFWARCTTLCDKVCQWLATGWWFLMVLWFPPPIKLTAIIVESGIKHHKNNQPDHRWLYYTCTWFPWRYYKRTSSFIPFVDEVKSIIIVPSDQLQNSLSRGRVA